MKFGENLPCSFFEILKFPRFSREVSKFQKSELGKFISNFPLKHVITGTNFEQFIFVCMLLTSILEFTTALCMDYTLEIFKCLSIRLSLSGRTT